MKWGVGEVVDLRQQDYFEQVLCGHFFNRYGTKFLKFLKTGATFYCCILLVVVLHTVEREEISASLIIIIN